MKYFVSEKGLNYSQYSKVILKSNIYLFFIASRLASNLYTSGTNLSRSVSSAGERQSEAYVSPLLPKRAETFGGFDNPTKEQTAPIKCMYNINLFY